MAGRSSVGRAASADRRSRVPLLGLAVIALIAGLWGALARIGLPVSAPVSLPASHGALMTMGFLGTVISLERSVALGRRAALAAPIFAGLGTLALIADLTAARALLLLAGIAFSFVCVWMLRARPEIATAAMALGGVAWIAAAAAVALGTPIARTVPLLAAFLVLTVAGERVGLSRIARPPRVSGPLFAAGSTLVFGGAAAAIATSDATRIAGSGLVILAVWLGLWDLAWRNVRRTGVTRYMAVALVAGYIWLGVAGVTWIVAPNAPTMYAYDALIHTVFVGFVLSMIFAHELMIVPALLAITLPFTRVFYVPLALLHASLAARIVGDVVADATVWQWAGLLNVAAVLLFAAATVASATVLRRT